MLPRLLPAVLLLGLAESMTGPYVVLFGSDRARLSPLAIGIFLSLTNVSGILVSSRLARHYDRAPSRLPAFIALATGALGYLCLTFTTSYPLLLVCAVVFLGPATACFPQLFTLARAHLDRVAPDANRRGTPALRSAWSLAWAIGPVTGGAVLSVYGFGTLFLATATTFLLVGLALVLLGPPPRRTADRDDENDGFIGPIAGRASSDPAVLRRLRLSVISFTLFFTAMFAGSVVLPLYVTDTLGRSDHEVGLMFTVCAIAEIPAALALMAVSARRGKLGLLLLGMVLFVTYFVLVGTTASIPVLLAAQVARGSAIAVVGALGITYFQDLLPAATGRATTLFANTSTTGALLAGVVAGGTAQAWGYRPALLLCGALSTLAGLLLVAAHRTGTPGNVKADR